MACDEGLSHLWPGNVLMADLVESCCSDPAIDRVDCTTWQPRHARWGKVREPTYQLVAFNTRLVMRRLAKVARSGHRPSSMTTGLDRSRSLGGPGRDGRGVSR